MKTATIKEIKTELETKHREEILQLCLRLSRFKKENKELLTYLLFEANDEDEYIEKVKGFIHDQFQLINTKNFYYIKKSVRKILRETKKYIRYTGNKETEVALLLFFSTELLDFQPSIKRNITLKNLLQRQIITIRKSLEKLHEDLQYDYNVVLEELENSLTK